MEVEDVRKRLTGDGEVEGESILADALFLLELVDKQTNVIAALRSAADAQANSYGLQLRAKSEELERVRAELSDTRRAADIAGERCAVAVSERASCAKQLALATDKVDHLEQRLGVVRAALLGGAS